MLNSDHFKINSPDVINETIEGESVIINLNSGFYYSLDHVGAEIWESLVQQLSVKTIIANLIQRYAGSADEIKRAVTELINQLKEENLIVPLSAQEPIKTEISNTSEQPFESEPFKKPVLNKFGDMQDLLLLDPIHEVDEAGWPQSNPGNQQPE